MESNIDPPIPSRLDDIIVLDYLPIKQPCEINALKYLPVWLVRVRVVDGEEAVRCPVRAGLAIAHAAA